MTKTETVVLTETKNYLKHHFVTKDMEKPRYFLGIEVRTRRNDCLFIRERMRWIYYKRLVYLDANILVYLWT